MLLDNLTKSTRSSKNVALVTLILIGVIAVYNWLVAPHRNYLLAAQKYESTAGNLAKKNQIIAKKVKNKTKELDRLQESAKLSVLGSYGGIAVLMNKLQERDEQVRIDSVTVKPIRRGSSRLKCDMNIAINVIQNKERGPDD